MANAGSFRKGEKRPNQGKHGSPKAILDLRAMVLGALDAAGGETYLAEQAQESPAAFLALVGKCLPKDVNLTAKLSLADLVREARAQINGKRS